MSKDDISSTLNSLLRYEPFHQSVQTFVSQTGSLRWNDLVAIIDELVVCLTKLKPIFYLSFFSPLFLSNCQTCTHIPQSDYSPSVTRPHHCTTKTFYFVSFTTKCPYLSSNLISLHCSSTNLCSASTFPALLVQTCRLLLNAKRHASTLLCLPDYPPPHPQNKPIGPQ
jgi:hypothetical protein